MTCPVVTETVWQYDGALSRGKLMPEKTSFLVDVTSIAQVPRRMGLRAPSALIWKEPAQLTKFVFQNCRLARRVLSVSRGSSGGFSSLLTKSPSLVKPAGNL